MIHSEGLIHSAIRRHLRQTGWTLVAGQFPGGSDDELRRMYIRDQSVARDNSPDPRRHSVDTDVPDLIAARDHDVLIVEMKPIFDKRDAAKVLRIIHERERELRTALKGFLGVQLSSETNWRGALGFSDGSARSDVSGLTFLLVRDVDTVIEDPSL